MEHALASAFGAFGFMAAVLAFFAAVISAAEERHWKALAFAFGCAVFVAFGVFGAIVSTRVFP